MNDWKYRVEIEVITDELIELRLADSPDNPQYLTWRIPIVEAQDLASWWEELFVPGALDLPLKDLRYRSIQISMYSPALVQIKGFDVYGSPKIVGWSLPTPAVEALVHYFSVSIETTGPFHGSGNLNGGITRGNAVQTAAQAQSALTNRVAVYFFDRSQHMLRHSPTPRCLVAERKEEGGHIPC
jgi:hypothetical protein